MSGITEKVELLTKRLREEGFKGNIHPAFPLAKLTWYRIGGPAAVLGEPVNTNDLVLLRKLSSEYSLPVLVLGGGSNLLVSDDGFPGLVISPAGEFEKLKIDIDIEIINIHSGAAISLMKLVREGTGAGFAGIERLAGIPGTVGGAIFMNAGTFGEHIDGLLASVEILNDENERVTLSPKECGFSYRTSRFQDSGEIILSCTLRSGKGNRDEIAAEIERRLERRRRTQPVDLPSCGCVFRNPEGDKSAARLIQDADLKGLRAGDAEISELHANFIVNQGVASAHDVLVLMARARRKVFEETGIRLVGEVRIAGFDESLEVMLDGLENE